MVGVAHAPGKASPPGRRAGHLHGRWCAELATKLFRYDRREAFAPDHGRRCGNTTLPLRNTAAGAMWLACAQWLPQVAGRDGRDGPSVLFFSSGVGASNGAPGGEAGRGVAFPLGALSATRAWAEFSEEILSPATTMRTSSVAAE